MQRLVLTLITAISLMMATQAAAFWGNPAPKSSDAQQAERQERAMQEANAAVGMPNITQFFEKRMVKMLYELRDNPDFATITYIATLDGKLVKICDSIGYGINASVQYSNPQKMVDRGGVDHGPTYAPQAEPNGLFMPEGLAATYVMCLNPETEQIEAVYLEPEIIVSPFPLTQ